MGRMKNLCDCGRQYLDFNGVEACQAGNHGQPRTCPDCEASRRKLEAAEEMAMVMKTISDLPETIIGKSVKEYAINAYAAWEKTGKGEG